MIYIRSSHPPTLKDKPGIEQAADFMISGFQAASKEEVG